MTVNAKVFTSTMLLVAPHCGAYSDTLEDQLLACRTITTDVERLRCLDKAIAVLQPTAPKANEIERTVNKPKQDYKVKAKPAPELGEKYLKDNDNPGEKEQVFNLIKAYKGHSERWVFEFENGQKWQQNEARYLPVPPQYPVKVTISEGTFGAYNLRADYLNKRVKVKRIR